MSDLLTTLPIRPRNPVAGSLYLRRTSSPTAVAAATATILALPSLLAWYSPRLAALTADAAVSSISDQSGGLVPAVQATGAAQPIYRAVAINGMPGLQFDGTDDFLQADALATTFAGSDKAFSVYVVSQRLAGTGQIYHWGMGRSSTTTPIVGGRVQNNYNQGRRDDAALTKDITGGTFTNAPHVTAWLFSGTLGEVWADTDNVVTSVDQDVGTITLDTFSLGALRRTTTSGFWNGYIGDVIICSALHNTANRRLAMGALGSVYGIVAG